MASYNITVPDGKSDFLLNMLNQYDFIEVTSKTSYEDEVLDNVRKGVEEMKLINQGVIQGIPARSVLDEL